MKILKQAGLGVVSFFIQIILIVIFTLVTSFVYGSLQGLLFAREDYLLFVQNNLIVSVISVILFGVLLLCALIYALILITQAFSKIKEKIKGKSKISNKETKDEKPDKFKIKTIRRIIAMPSKFKIKIICFIITLIIATYCGMINHTFFYADSIKVRSPIAPLGVIYSYSDIKNIDAGIKNDRYHNPYYEIIFNDGKTIDLFNGQGNDEDLIQVLIEFDSKFRAQGVTKHVDKTYFEEFSDGMDKDYVNSVEKLLEDY